MSEIEELIDRLARKAQDLTYSKEWGEDALEIDRLYFRKAKAELLAKFEALEKELAAANEHIKQLKWVANDAAIGAGAYQAETVKLRAELAALREANRWRDLTERPENEGYYLALIDHMDGSSWQEETFYHRTTNEWNGAVLLWRALPEPTEVSQ